MSGFIRTISFLFVLSAISGRLWAQVFSPKYATPIGANCNGFYEYLPSGYDPLNTQKYPLLIALHGSGERGDGTANAATGLPLLILPGKGMASLINSGQFPASFNVGGNIYRFIVICPQFTNNGPIWPDENDLSAIIAYAISHYKVDLNRVYLTGLSMGGGIGFRYVTNNSVNASQIAAFVPVCAALQPGPPYAPKPDSLACRTITASNLPLWATHNAGDATVPSSFTDSLEHYVNAAPAPTPIARKTIFTTWIFDHDAWTQTYDPAYTGFDLKNMYEWMLQYQRFISPLPVQLKNYRATLTGRNTVTISWQTEYEINNDHFTLERSANGRDYVAIARIDGMNRGGYYSYIDDQPLKENFYRLSQTDKDGKITYFDILKVTLPAEEEITLLQNPVTDLLRLKLPYDRQALTITIRNSGGSLTRQWSTKDLDGLRTNGLLVNDLPKGIYFIEIRGKDFVYALPFIKN